MSAPSTTTESTSGTANRADVISRLSKGQRLAAEHPQLGKIRDVELAKKIGVSRTTVELARRKVGILSARDSVYEKQRALILAQEDLGKVRDNDIAKRLGLGIGMVRLTRLKAGVRSDFEKAPGKATAEAAATMKNSELLRRWGR